MENQAADTMDTTEIRLQNMQVTIKNRCLRYSGNRQKTLRQEIEKQLFQIFRKYDG